MISLIVASLDTPRIANGSKDAMFSSAVTVVKLRYQMYQRKAQTRHLYMNAFVKIIEPTSFLLIVSNALHLEH